MSKMFAITLAIVAAVVSCQAVDPLPKVQMDLADLLMRSSAAMRSNPEQTSACFNTYTPKLNAIATEYQTKLDGCQNDANAANEKINQEVAGNIASINQWHEEICGGYSKCNQGASDPRGFFECNTNAAAPAITTSYSIETMSKDKMEYVTAQYSMINYNKKSCSDTCQDTYVKTSKSLYDQLQACIAAAPAPVEPTTTTAAPVEPEQ